MWSLKVRFTRLEWALRFTKSANPVGRDAHCQAHIGNTLSNNMGYTFSGDVRLRFLETINLCSVSICANSNAPYCKPTTCSEM